MYTISLQNALNAYNTFDILFSELFSRSYPNIRVMHLDEKGILSRVADERNVKVSNRPPKRNARRYEDDTPVGRWSPARDSVCVCTTTTYANGIIITHVRAPANDAYTCNEGAICPQKGVRCVCVIIAPFAFFPQKKTVPSSGAR